MSGQSGDQSGGTSGGTSAPAAKVMKVSALAVPFLGFLGAIQGSAPNIASTALVGASKSLDMAGSTQALAASMQTLAIAATVITAGLVADRIGRRNLLLVALVVGAVGNLIVLASPAVGVYLLGQAVVGVGLGATYGAAFGFMKSVVKPEKLAGAMGLFTAAVMVFTLVLTFVGGTLASANWRTAYLLIPVMCAVAFVLTPLLLPRLPRVTGGSFDVVGQIVLGLGIVGVLYGFSQFATSLTSPRTLVPLVAGVVLLVAFVVWEGRYAGAFFPVALLRSPVFLGALCFGFVYNFGTAVSFLQLTNLWQYVNGITTSKAAIWQLPLLLSGIVAGVVTGRVMGRGLRNRTAGLVGGVTAAAGFVYLAIANGATSLVGFAPGMVLVGGGVVIAAVPFGNLILREAPARYLGPVSSSRTMFGQVFYTLGFALSTVAIDRLTRGGVVERLTAAGVPANQLGTGIDAVTAYAGQGTQPTTSLGKQALADAITSYGDAFRTTFLVAAAAILVLTLLATLLLRGGEGEPQPAHEDGAPLEHEPA